MGTQTCSSYQGIMALSVLTLPPCHKCPLWRLVSEKQTLSLLVSVDIICVILFSVFLGGERMSPLSHVPPLSALVLVEAKAQGSMNGLSSQSHQRSRGSAPSFLTPESLGPRFLPNSPKFPQCLSRLSLMRIARFNSFLLSFMQHGTSRQRPFFAPWCGFHL